MIHEVFLNSTLITALVSMFIAQVIKIIYYPIVERKLNWHHAFEAGGMPSSHSALVCSLIMMIGFTEGFDSSIFAITAVFAAIVMYDAIKVRHEEVVHTLVEVSAGAILGIAVAVLSYLYF
jgi:acid phosphatase family membrane protein YuiD